MTGHSPGPWVAETNLGCKRIRQRVRKNYLLEVACTPGLYDDDEDKANAKLIAAAPDMKAALQRARNLIGPDEIIDAALAKAGR